jgi:hypothetical protein
MKVMDYIIKVVVLLSMCRTYVRMLPLQQYRGATRDGPVLNNIQLRQIPVCIKCCGSWLTDGHDFLNINFMQGMQDFKTIS